MSKRGRHEVIVPRVCKCGNLFNDTNYTIKKSSSNTSEYLFTLYLSCFECKKKFHSCVCCSAIFKTPKDMYHHFQSAHNSDITCHLCHSVFGSANIYKHYMEHYQEQFQRIIPTKRRKTDQVVSQYLDESVLETSQQNPSSITDWGGLDIDNFDPDEYVDIDGFREEEIDNDIVQFEVSGEETLIPPKEINQDIDIQGSAETLEDIPMLDEKPPARTISYSDLGFRSYNAFHYAVKHVVLSSLTVQQSDELLRSIKNVYFKSTVEKALLPDNTAEIMRCLRNLPTQKPQDSIYSIKTTLSRIFNSQEHTAEITLRPPEDMPNSVSEYTESDHFRFISSLCEEDVYPISLSLYYDKFRNYRICPGSSGGLYFSLMNFSRKHRSKPRNIFLVSLLKEGNNYETIMQRVIQEISSLSAIHQVYHAGIQKFIKIRVFLGIYVADMPERHIACGMMCHSGNASKCIHCMVDCNSLGINPSSNDKRFKKRSETVSKKQYQKCLENYKIVKTKTSIISDTSYYGISLGRFNLENESFSPNIFWNIPQFDVHTNTPPDLFHSVILGVIRTHLELIIEKLNTVEVEQLSSIANSFKFKETALPTFSGRAYWNGDQWLRFWLVSPFILQKFFFERGEVSDTSRITSKSLLTTWFDQVQWVKTILQSSLSKEEVNQSEMQCLKWRELMVSVFGGDRLSFPNFHCIIHLFDCARLFGPPVLYWARPYEHKHKTFRRYIAQSNKRNSEVWSAEKEMMLQCIQYLFPEFRVRPQKQAKQLPVDLNIIFRSNGSLEYGKIVSYVGSDQYIVQKYSFVSRHSILKFFQFKPDQLGLYERISYDDMVSRFYVTHGFVNSLYNILNFAALKTR